jgi:RNA-directed DNA polymerase
VQPILSIRDLSSRLGISIARLQEIGHDIKAHYKSRPLVDKDDKQKIRMLTVPANELKDIQRRIKNILAQVTLAQGVYGGVRGGSPRKNAEQHLNQPCVVNLDVRSFFPKIRHYMVFRMFRYELGFGRDVAHLLTRLTTFDGQVPQGAPTSTAIANILLTMPVDGPVSVEAERSDVRYTRFVDDITMSGTNPRPLINFVARMLSRRRLPMYRKKTKGRSKPKLKITANSRAQEVTGLIVNAQTGLSVSRTRRDKIRALIFSLRNTTDQVALRKKVNSVHGKIAYVRQFNKGAASRLAEYLDSTLQLGNSVLRVKPK